MLPYENTRVSLPVVISPITNASLSFPMAISQFTNTNLRFPMRQYAVYNYEPRISSDNTPAYKIYSKLRLLFFHSLPAFLTWGAALFRNSTRVEDWRVWTRNDPLHIPLVWLNQLSCISDNDGVPDEGRAPSPVKSVLVHPMTERSTWDKWNLILVQTTVCCSWPTSNRSQGSVCHFLILF